MAVTFITSTQIVDHLITIIKANADIAEFIEDNEMNELVIFDNPEALNPPGETDVPFIAIYRHRIIKGERKNEWIYEFEMEAGIKDDTTTTDNGVVYQNGVRTVEEFGYLVYNAIRDGLSCNLGFDEADIMIDESCHPLYIAYYGFKITVERVIGVDIEL